MKTEKYLENYDLRDFENFIENNFPNENLYVFDFYKNMGEVMKRMKEYVCDMDHYSEEDILTDNAGLNTIFWELENGCVLSERFSDKQYVFGDLIDFMKLI